MNPATAEVTIHHAGRLRLAQHCKLQKKSPKKTTANNRKRTTIPNPPAPLRRQRTAESTNHADKSRDPCHSGCEVAGNEDKTKIIHAKSPGAASSTPKHELSRKQPYKRKWRQEKPGKETAKKNFSEGRIECASLSRNRCQTKAEEKQPGPEKILESAAAKIQSGFRRSDAQRCNPTAETIRPPVHVQGATTVRSGPFLSGSRISRRPVSVLVTRCVRISKNAIYLYEFEDVFFGSFVIFASRLAGISGGQRPARQIHTSNILKIQQNGRKEIYHVRW